MKKQFQINSKDLSYWVKLSKNRNLPLLEYLSKARLQIIDKGNPSDTIG